MAKKSESQAPAKKTDPKPPTGGNTLTVAFNEPTALMAEGAVAKLDININADQIIGISVVARRKAIRASIKEAKSQRASVLKDLEKANAALDKVIVAYAETQMRKELSALENALRPFVTVEDGKAIFQISSDSPTQSPYSQ